jgi:hypothetical protein
MPVRAPGSAWSGRARRWPALWCISVLLLSGCAALFPREYSAMDHLAFLTRALDADARGREALWRTYGRGGATDDAQLRVALLQSVPGHAGYDPAAARVRLDALAGQNPAPVEVATVARLRLAEMNETVECRNEATELRARLARVVDIERRLNQDN